MKHLPFILFIIANNVFLSLVFYAVGSRDPGADPIPQMESTFRICSSDVSFSMEVPVDWMASTSDDYIYASSGSRTQNVSRPISIVRVTRYQGEVEFPKYPEVGDFVAKEMLNRQCHVLEVNDDDSGNLDILVPCEDHYFHITVRSPAKISEVFYNLVNTIKIVE